jgi:heme exporter protein A
VLYRGHTTKDICATLGWLGTESSLYPDLTARQNIALAARLRGLHPVTAWFEACDRFLVGELAERPVRTLSRGQRQRVALARALAHRPNLILLDEPTAGLDPATVQSLIRVIRHERERGALVILVTHEHPLAVEIGDDAYEMSSGRLRYGPSSPAP